MSERDDLSEQMWEVPATRIPIPKQPKPKEA